MCLNVTQNPTSSVSAPTEHQNYKNPTCQLKSMRKRCFLKQRNSSELSSISECLWAMMGLCNRNRAVYLPEFIWAPCCLIEQSRLLLKLLLKASEKCRQPLASPWSVRYNQSCGKKGRRRKMSPVWQTVKWGPGKVTGHAGWEERTADSHAEFCL